MIAAWIAVAVIVLGGAALLAMAAYVEHLQRDIDERQDL